MLSTSLDTLPNVPLTRDGITRGIASAAKCPAGLGKMSRGTLPVAERDHHDHGPRPPPPPPRSRQKSSLLGALRKATRSRKSSQTLRTCLQGGAKVNASGAVTCARLRFAMPCARAVEVFTPRMRRRGVSKPHAFAKTCARLRSWTRTLNVTEKACVQVGPLCKGVRTPVQVVRYLISW